jgi:hypothetical protein
MQQTDKVKALVAACVDRVKIQEQLGMSIVRFLMSKTGHVLSTMSQPPLAQ